MPRGCGNIPLFMERTASLQVRRARVWFWVWLGLVSGQALLVLWLGTRDQLHRELEVQERLFAAAVGQLSSAAEAAASDLKAGAVEQLVASGPWRHDPLMGVMIRRREDGSLLCWPPTLAAMANKIEPLLPSGRGWALVEDGEWGTRGVVAVRVARAEVDGVMFVELPRLLLESLGPTLRVPLLVWVAAPEGDTRFFSCEPQGRAQRGWSCYPQRRAPFDGIGSLLGEGKVALAGGTSLGKRVRLAGQSVPVGVYVPNQSVGTLSPVWLFLVGFWAFLVGSAVLVWRHWSAVEAQNMASQTFLARQEAELSARIAEVQWHLLLEGVKEPLLFLRDDLVVRANQAAARLLGYEHRADLLGRRLEELLAPEERERVKKLLPATTLALGAFTTHFLGAKGRRRTVEVRPWSLDAGGESLVCLSLEDFTSRERLEKLLRAVASAVNVGVALLEPRGEVAWCNPALAEALGLSSEELQGKSLLAFVVPGSRREVRRAFVRAMRGESASAVASCRLKGGAISSLELVFRGFRVAGAMAGVVLVAQRLGLLPGQGPEPEIIAPLHELVAHYLHRIANVVQTPLARTPTGKGATTVLHQSFAQVAELVHHLALFLRLHSSGLVPADLEELVTSMEGELQSVLPPGVRLAVRRWGAPAPVRCDPEQLRLFVRSAVEASVECVRGGVGTVEVAVERLGSGSYRLAVSDTGEVLSPEEAPGMCPGRVRARAMAYCVARRHMGEWGFRERTGFGARVWVDLPPALPESESTEVSGPAQGKILLVDDEAAIREGLAELLRAEGYEVLEAANGREALALYDADPEGIALVVLDLVMPEMDGRQVYAELMRRQRPPVVLLSTGYDPRNDPSLASAKVLIKPFTVDAFLEAVRRVVLPGSQWPPREKDEGGAW